MIVTSSPTIPTDEESGTQVKADLLESELHSREARAADPVPSLRFRRPSLDPRSL